MKLIWQVDIRFSEFAHKFDIDRHYFKVNELKIVCGVSPARDGSMLAVGHLISFDDLDVQED